MTAAAGMAQVNVRMSPELKAAGEAAMSASGVTPTEVLRWVYETFAEGRESIARLLREGTAARVVDEAPAADDRGALLLKGIDDRYAALYASLGLDQRNLPSAVLEDDELDRLFWDERDRERGLGAYAN